MPKDIPFEIYCLYRFLHIPKYNEHDFAQFSQEQMFRFEDEFIFQQVKVEIWTLSYCLFQPLAAASTRLMLKQMLGQEYDKLPLIHPVGYP